MLPIVIEMIVSTGWARTRRAVNIREDLIWLNRAEYWVWYFWVTGWFMWSVPKYIDTRMSWTDEKLRKEYGED
jgi:hypothetical protein